MSILLTPKENRPKNNVCKDNEVHANLTSLLQIYLHGKRVVGKRITYASIETLNDTFLIFFYLLIYPFVGKTDKVKKKMFYMELQRRFFLKFHVWMKKRRMQNGKILSLVTSYCKLVNTFHNTSAVYRSG